MKITYIKLNKYKTASFKPISDKNLYVQGLLGHFKSKFSGKDVVSFQDELFFYSKTSFRTFSSILERSIKGIERGYYAKLSFVGLGYRFIYNNDRLLLKLGYAHYIELYRPKDLHIFGYKKNLILFSTNYRSLNNFIYRLTSFQKIDSYKGKGIQRYGIPLKLKIGKQKL